MAITVLPGQKSMGEAFGTGLGSGLTNLANLKMQQLQKQGEQRRLAQALSSSGLVAPQHAEAYSQLPPTAITQLFKNQMAGQQQQGLMQQAAQQLDELSQMNQDLSSFGRFAPGSSSLAQRFSATAESLKPLFKKLGISVPTNQMNYEDANRLIGLARQKLGAQPGADSGQQQMEQMMPGQDGQQMPGMPEGQQQMQQPQEQPGLTGMTPFEQERQMPTGGQGMPETIARLLGIGAKGATAGIIGLPGELASFLGAGSDTKFSNAARAVAEGEGVKDYKSIPQRLSEASPVRLKNMTINGIDESLTKAIEPYIGKGKATPQGTAERLVDRTMKEFSGSALLGGPWKQMLSSAALGNIAAEGARQLGHSPITQSLAHLSFGLLPALVNGRSPLQKQKKAGYDAWEKAITEDPKGIPAARIKNALNKADTMITKNPAEGTKVIKKQMNAINGMIQENKIPMLDIWNKKKDMNALKYKELGEKEISKTAQDAWKVIQDGLLDTLHKNGPTYYKDAYPIFKNAEEINTGLELGKSGLKQLGDALTGRFRGFTPKSHILRTILINSKKMPLTAGGTVAGAVGGAIVGAPSLGLGLGLGAGAIGQEGLQYMRFLRNTPSAPKAVMHLMTHSIARRPAAMLKELKAIDSMAANYEKKQYKNAKPSPPRSGAGR